MIIISLSFVYYVFAIDGVQAEDVMGSLLKEYLNAPQKLDEISDTSGTNDKETTSAGEKDTLINKALDPKESTSHDLVNNKNASDCSENGGQEAESQLHRNCASESGNTSVQQFKNVVAIVDPPRVGLHPIVSYMLLCCVQFYVPNLSFFLLLIVNSTSVCCNNYFGYLMIEEILYFGN